jgi:predicted aminopeptidase
MPERSAVRRSVWRAAGIASVLAACLPGCATIDYYWQSAHGQYELLRRAQPLDEAIAQAQDPRVKARLTLAKSIRAFAVSDLDLPDNGSYRRYTELDRPYVLWNIFATPELSLKPREWCYPVAGCVSYRGYFSEAEARAQAQLRRAAGDDVYVGGVPAYSTLGWFDDPILSSFIRYPETDFARLMFHELAHQELYVQGDTVFNESFASAVEETGLDRWIAAQPAADQARLVAERARSQRLRAEFRRLVGTARRELAADYASAASDSDKRARKQAVLAALRAGYDEARAGEAGLASYERWFTHDGGPNNASLAAFGLYTDRVPAFRALLAQENGELPRFYARVKELAAMPKAERDAQLNVLAPSPAPLQVTHGGSHE